VAEVVDMAAADMAVAADTAADITDNPIRQVA
jgi:hypothetical protein